MYSKTKPLFNCSAHYSSISGEFCRECPGGKFSEPGGLCKECDPGKFSKDGTGTGCIDCPLGRFNPEGGLTTCQDCPYGKTTSFEGNILQTSCVNCPRGKVSHKYEYRGLASCNSDSSNRILVYEGLDDNGNNDNPGEDEAAQATACYTRCKSYRLHTIYDEPTPPPEVLTQEQCKKYSEDHHLSWAGDSYTSAEYPKGCFIWQNSIHYNLNNFSTGNCNFNSAQCIILPSLMYSKSYNSTAFTLNVLSQPGRCYCELETYESCSEKNEGYLERNWKYFNLDLTDTVLCKHCILGTNSTTGGSYCDSCKAGSYGTIHFVVVGSGYNDNSISREECRQLSIQQNRETWDVNSQSDRPVGCYRSNNDWRYNYNGELECGTNNDYCIQKTVPFILVETGNNDGSLSEEECEKLSIQNNRNSWEVVFTTERPKGCYRSGDEWRFAPNGQLECGTGTDKCVQATIPIKYASSGRNDDSLSEEECEKLSIQNNRNSWGVVYTTERPHGCFRSGDEWRFAPNGNLECGTGTDICIKKQISHCLSCEIGQYEDRVHSDHCKNCADGQFQNITGQVGCRDWHLCVAGEEERAVPTKDADRDCALCPAGKASDVIYYQTPENCQQKELAILDREECLVAYNNAPYRTGVHGNRTLFHCYDGEGGTCEESYEVHENGTVTDLSHSTIYGTTWEDYSEHTYETWQQFCSAWPNNNNVFNGGLGGCTTPVPMLRVPTNRNVGYGIQSMDVYFLNNLTNYTLVPRYY